MTARRLATNYHRLQAQLHELEKRRDQWTQAFCKSREIVMTALYQNATTRDLVLEPRELDQAQRDVKEAVANAQMRLQSATQVLKEGIK